MPTVDVTNIVLNDELKDLDYAYNNDPKVKAAIDQFDNECRLRRELTEARKQKNMTQVQIKELTGLTQQVISRIETNTDISPSLKNLMVYANAIGYELTLQPKT
jgi:DNA-binding XRE family transcriptional regulator